MPLKAADKWLARGDDPYLPRPKDSPAVVAWRARMGTAEAAEVYEPRASTAEWVNAGRRNRGLYQFPVRGLTKVRCCALWQALAHNLKGVGGRKIGNAHLKWAFSEAASLMLRSFAPAKAWVQRQAKKRGAKKGKRTVKHVGPSIAMGGCIPRPQPQSTTVTLASS